MSFSGGGGSTSAMDVFTAFFVVFWVGATVVSVNAKLLGSTLYIGGR